jgi:hypothetical protein
MQTTLWQRAEWTFESANDYDNPLQDAQLTATFRAPSGKEHKVYGFWDGGATWRVRFAPDELGDWHYQTTCSDRDNAGLHAQGRFTTIPATGTTRFQQHGRLKLSENRHYFVHEDGTPFFWLADTCWNGPLLAEDDDWRHYLDVRTEQRFTAVQWVATQWLAAPDGDRHGHKAYEGHERICINLDFFRQLERKHNAIVAAGLLSVPVMLWAANWNPEFTQDNPGAVLPEDQAVLLARYMLARWGADPVAWFLPGDGPYQDAEAERWRRIGRAVFGGVSHAPVSLHPNGQQWIGNFKDESWLDFIGYQSGHGDGHTYDLWLLEGPPAQQWRTPPIHPVINVEPPYENHVAYQSQIPFNAWATRKRLYWSLLVAPTAGVTYGGHGVWGWDDGSGPPTAHPKSGTPLPWREALKMPAARQLAHLHALFSGLKWWRLQPAPELLVNQPGRENSEHYLMAARSTEGDIALVYVPHNTDVTLKLTALQEPLSAHWVEPRSGKTLKAQGTGPRTAMTFAVPAGEDWLLVFTAN